MIEFADFQKVEMKTGRVLQVDVHPNADKLFVVKVDLGAGETRTLVAGLRAFYAPEALVGKTVIVVANLQPRPLRGVDSQGMILAVHDGDRVKVLTVDGGEATPGVRVT
jgi:methionyl-tRNA synthetase